jgi:hypothetical protein
MVGNKAFFCILFSSLVHNCFGEFEHTDIGDKILLHLRMEERK